MMYPWLSTMMILVAAHAIGDFLLQTRRDIGRKDHLLVLTKHGLIHAGLSYLLIGLWSTWILPVTIFLGHVLIDWIKTTWQRKGPVLFLIDQVAHLTVLACITTILVQQKLDQSIYWQVDLGWTIYSAVLTLCAGSIVTVRMGCFLIAEMVAPYQKELHDAIEEARSQNTAENEHLVVPPSRGLAQAGSVIGQLERALIFLFVFNNSLSAIGFLVAAKSIFRFGELRDKQNRMESEYILIGTLLSFGFGLVAALGTRAIYQLLI